jgi:uncharacterized protein (TIGR02118 family)
MIKVSVMYPNKPAPVRSDVLPREAHADGQGAHGLGTEVLRCRKWRRRRQPRRFGDVRRRGAPHCDSIDDFQRGFGPHTQEIMGDIPNYTDQAPVVQIGEVLVEKG